MILCLRCKIIWVWTRLPYVHTRHPTVYIYLLMHTWNSGSQILVKTHIVYVIVYLSKICYCSFKVKYPKRKKKYYVCHLSANTRRYVRLLLFRSLCCVPNFGRDIKTRRSMPVASVACLCQPPLSNTIFHASLG